MKRTFLALMGMALMAVAAWSQTAREIITRVEGNEIHQTAIMEGSVVITDRFGEKTITFKSWARGRSDSLVEFTSGEERGQKILRTAKDIYLFYPDAEEVIRIQGAALRDSVAGSDLSYQDMAGDKSLLDSYNVQIVASERIGDSDCWKLELTATVSGVAYYRQFLWVEKSRFYVRKAQYFALSGKLIKEMEVLETMQVAGKTIMSRASVQDMLKGDSRTEFVIKSARIGVTIPARTFSLEGLSM